MLRKWFIAAVMLLMPVAAHAASDSLTLPQSSASFSGSLEPVGPAERLPGVGGLEPAEQHQVPHISKKEVGKMLREKARTGVVNLFPEYGEDIFRGAEIVGGVAVTAYKFLQDGDDLSTRFSLSESTRLKLYTDRDANAGVSFNWDAVPSRNGRLSFDAGHHDGDYRAYLQFRIDLN